MPNRIGEAIYQGLDYLSLAQPCSAFWRSEGPKYPFGIAWGESAVCTRARILQSELSDLLTEVRAHP